MKRIALLAAVAAAFGLPGAESVAGAKQLRVAYVASVGAIPGGRDINGIIYRGFVRAVKEPGVTGRVYQVALTQDPAAVLSSVARQKYDLIVTGLDLTPEVVNLVAPRFPQSKFLMTDFSYELLRRRPKNVQGVVFRSEQSAYLAGYLAGLMEKRRPGRDVIGAVGGFYAIRGFKIASVDAFITGYRAGARKAAPRITTLIGYSNSFVNPSKCTAVALDQIARGAGVVFQVAGFCGLGTLAAAKQAGVWGIGVDVDQSYLGPHILTSAIKRSDLAVVTAVESLVGGTFRTGGDLVFDLRNGGVGLGKISPKVPRSLLAQVEVIRKQIVAGKIRVPATLGR